MQTTGLTTQEAFTLLTSIEDQMGVLMEQQGLYKALWERYKAKGETDPVGQIMQNLEILYNNLQTVFPLIRAKKQSEQSLTSDEVQQVRKIQTDLDSVVAALSKAEALVRKDDEKVSFADALSVLSSMKSQQKDDDWALATKRMQSFLKKGTVVGPSKSITKITGLIAKYVSDWDSLGTDGLKGVKFGDLQSLELARVAIAKAVAESGSIYLQVTCSEGTTFYKYIASLAAQSCSSKDVQTFKGWWAKNFREFDE